MLTNDGLTGFRRVGGSAGTPARARSRRLASRPDRRRPDVQLPAAPGHPLLDRRARAAAGLPPRDRAHARAGARRSLLRARTTRHRRRTALPGRAEEAVRPLAGDRDRRRPRTRSPSTSPRPTPTSSTSSRSPPRSRCPPATPLHPRGFVPATGPYEIASFDPKRGIRLVRNPRFHEWSPAAQPSGFPDEIVERVQGSADAHVAAVLRGSADLASGETAPVAGRARLRADAACEPARAQPVGHHLLPRSQHAGRRRSTTCASAGR